jgi:hypothetical protein
MSKLSEWDTLPLRERQELASALRTGIASPFWTEYRAWLEELFSDAVRGLIPPSSDIPSILAGEHKKGRLAGIDQAMHAAEAFLADILQSIAAETAEEPTDDRPIEPFADSP